MASSKLKMNTIDEAKQDLICNLPAIATEKFLKRLPLIMAAKMSLLSRKWKENWLSQRHLVFDSTFWEGRGGQKDYNGIISSILFYRNGPIHKFRLLVPISVSITCIHLSQWLSFLSKTNVKKIALINFSFEHTSIPSHIFSCKELVKLRLLCFTLNPPPRDFKGFTNLRSLSLWNIKFKQSYVLASLNASCSRLIVLKLEHCVVLDTVIIDVPSLERLVISGDLECLCLKSIVRLNSISLCLNEYPDSDAVELNSIRDLATSCQLQYLHFGGRLCKDLAASGVTKSLPLSFNYLSKLCLTEINLGRVDVYHFVIGMVQSCPCIRDLEISVLANTDVFQLEIDCDYRIDSYK
ncbi:F-box/FBD/LRR-repeat protein At1g13570-like [Chenopodium quinoa]|uniref:F-box/FBD/LRR-repeat protein At1g13570-like n=1 Tax=Chenopodium quinoa TaxID=63459 RepID=UPI000B78BD97|nr:F-box/FBD/LRR-repeat protein At1g13570-like [Chenopodium quinoa]